MNCLELSVATNVCILTCNRLSYKRWSLTCGRTQCCVLLRVTPTYCCAIQWLPRNLETHGAERSKGKGGEARRGSAPLLLRIRVPRGFCSSTSPIWGEYAIIFIIISLLTVQTLLSTFVSVLLILITDSSIAYTKILLRKFDYKVHILCDTKCGVFMVSVNCFQFYHQRVFKFYQLYCNTQEPGYFSRYSNLLWDERLRFDFL
jgi:hypothetical protein